MVQNDKYCHVLNKIRINAFESDARIGRCVRSLTKKRLSPLSFTEIIAAVLIPGPGVRNPRLSRNDQHRLALFLCQLKQC